MSQFKFCRKKTDGLICISTKLYSVFGCSYLHLAAEQREGFVKTSYKHTTFGSSWHLNVCVPLSSLFPFLFFLTLSAHVEYLVLCFLNNSHLSCTKCIFFSWNTHETEKFPCIFFSEFSFCFTANLSSKKRVSNNSHEHSEMFLNWLPVFARHNCFSLLSAGVNSPRPGSRWPWVCHSKQRILCRKVAGNLGLWTLWNKNPVAQLVQRHLNTVEGESSLKSLQDLPNHGRLVQLKTNLVLFDVKTDPNTNPTSGWM